MSCVSSPVDNVLDRFEKVRRSGPHSWKALCPNHIDLKSSLHITLNEEGNLLIYCHGGCSSKDVLESAGLEMKDLFVGGGGNSSGKSPGTLGGCGFDSHPTPPTNGSLSPTLRSEVYVRLVDLLTLDERDKQLLIDRGLSQQVITENEYRSLSFLSAARAVETLREMFVDIDLLKVPGFRKHRDGRSELVVKDGLLIPVRGPNGIIRGFQARTEEDSKYVWLSGGGGPTVGSPAHVRRSLGQDFSSIILTEGPLKADVIHHLDGAYPVVGIPGVASWRKTIPLLERMGVEEVRLAFDMDWTAKDGVRAALLGCARSLAKKFSLVLYLWNVKVGKGLDDFLLKSNEIETIVGSQHVLDYLFPNPARFIEGAPDKREMLFRDQTIDQDNEDSLDLEDEVIPFSEIESRPVDWLWKGWIPRGCLTLLDGDPGLGKSTFLTDLVARLTMGWTMPPGGKTPEGCAGIAEKVLLLSAEDDPSRVICPRLEVAGADLSYVSIHQGIRVKEGNRLEPVRLPSHFDQLENRIKADRYSLVIVDPFFSYLDGEINSHRDQDIRRVTSRLAKIAEDTQSAIFLVRHLNKMTGGSSLYRGGGSIGVIASVRSAILAGKHPDDPEKRVLVVQKANLCRPPKGLTYRFEDQGEVARIVWEGETDLTPDDLFRTEKGRNRDTVLEKAVCFLESQLSKGPADVNTLERRAKIGNISFRTLQTAKKELGIVSTRDGSSDPPKWLWSLLERGEK